MAKKLKEKPVKKNKKEKSKKKGKRGEPELTLSQSFLQAIAPLGNIEFTSDYFRTGLYYGTVLTFVAESGGVTGLPPMWGTRMVPVVEAPDGSNETVSARLSVSIQNRPKKWVQDRAEDASHVAEGAMADAASAHQGLELSKRQLQAMSHEETMYEISKHAAYADVTYKIVLYATSREVLEYAVRALNNHYKSIFGAVRLTRYIGQQQDDYEQLLYPATEKLGLHDGYTSTELAGFYPFVGQGWIDQGGDYIGITAGDIHQMPVIYRSESIKKLAVIASNDKAHFIGAGDDSDNRLNANGASAWSTFITQGELLAGRNVYELVLNDEDLDEISGFDLSASTLELDVNQPLINPLQAFGAVEDELQMFSVLLKKLELMFLQQQPDLDGDDLIVLNESLREFYVLKNLWSHNAVEDRESLRLVGIKDPTEYPTMRDLMLYLSMLFTQANGAAGSDKQDSYRSKIYFKLGAVVKTLIAKYGIMFDTHTTLDFSRFMEKPRKVFKFSNLYRSGREVVMMQFLNMFSFISNYIQPGDSVHIYGADIVTPEIWEYIQSQSIHLWNRGIRLVVSFASTKQALHNPLFDEADTVLMGQMSTTDVADYSQYITGTLPDALVKQITNGDDRIYYLRRGRENAVFYWDRSF